MADAKKDSPSRTGFEEIMLLLFFLFFLSILIARIEEILAYWQYGSLSQVWLGIKAYFVYHMWPIIKFIAFLISAICIVGIVMLNTKMRALNKEEKQLYGLKDVEIEDGRDSITNKNEKWERVLEHISSANPGDWRLAIIEADIILDDLLRASGYHGDTVGDMLKSVEVSDFTTVESAWQAHKIRNRIAHSGGDFHLNEREAKQAIALYEAVFKEFKVI